MTVCNDYNGEIDLMRSRNAKKNVLHDPSLPFPAQLELEQQHCHRVSILRNAMEEQRAASQLTPWVEHDRVQEMTSSLNHDREDTREVGAARISLGH
jgi:hypothetical protein